jgi:hypothetical protein
MISIHPKYIKDTAGKNLVILPQKEFDTTMEELEDIEDVSLYDEAKKKSQDKMKCLDSYIFENNLLESVYCSNYKLTCSFSSKTIIVLKSAIRPVVNSQLRNECKTC